MAWRIARTTESILDTKRVEQPDYLDFIRSLPCVVTGAEGDTVEVAHISGRNLASGHSGRAKSGKASDMWTLPLCSAQHYIQGNKYGNSGAGELAYWRSVHIHPYRLCLALYGAWNCHGPEVAEEVCRQIIARAKEL